MSIQQRIYSDQASGVPTFEWRRIRQVFLQTPVGECPYLPDRMERKLVTWFPTDDQEIATQLSHAGFRRSHDVAYRPICGTCQACKSLRVPVATFEPSRTQRKVWRANQGLSFALAPAEATDEHFDLFHSYIKGRHGDGDMADMGPNDLRAMIEDGAGLAMIAEWRYENGRLAAACLVDRFSDGLSAIYSFYDTTIPRQSLGTYIVLSLIDECHMQGLEFLYMGFWVSESPKMAYKSNFRPSQVLDKGQWQPI